MMIVNVKRLMKMNDDNINIMSDYIVGINIRDIPYVVNDYNYPMHILLYKILGV